MLILTRYPGQMFFINTPSGDEITITNLGVDAKTKQVRIGIKAPDEYKIVREELVGRGGDTNAALNQMQASGYCSPKQAALNQKEGIKNPTSSNGGQSRPPRVFTNPADG